MDMTTSRLALPELTEMRPGLSTDEVRRRLAGAARREETGQRVLAFYLVEMDARRLYQASGHWSTAHYAEVRLGLDRRRTAELLRVGRRLLELRETDRAFCDGRLGWAKVLVVARMAVPEHEAAWLERALALDCRELSLLAARSREGGPPRRPGDEKGLPEIRFPVSASLDALVHAKLDGAQRKLAAELGREVDLAGLLGLLLDDFLTSEAAGTEAGTEGGRKRVDASLYRVVLLDEGHGRPLLVETEDGPVPIPSWPADMGGAGGRAAHSECVRCDAGARNAHGTDHRARDVKTPPGMRGRVLRRDGRRCRSCRSQRSLMVHHIEFRAHGGRTLAENLITVCSRCHGLVHAGLLVIEGTSAESARFIDAAGRTLEGAERTPSIEAPVAAAAAQQSETALVSLAMLPREIDGAWWRRHAHLVKDRGENGGLRFEAGTPLDAPPTTPPAPPTRPETAFEGLLGQGERVERLRAVAAGCRVRGKPFPHVLLTGPAGTGKTTLARGIAAATSRPLVEVSAPLVADRATWIRLLAGLEEGSLLFLDEAHALPRAMLDALLQALSEGRLTFALSDGVSARSVVLELARFTLVAATTDEGAIPPALRSRFGLREALVHYGEAALAEVVRAAAAAAGASASDEAARRLAEVARGTPREALRLLDLALTQAAGRGESCLDGAGVGRALLCLGYDGEDLDPTEQRYMGALRASRVPIPLSRLARQLGTTPRTLVEHVEPWLFARGLVRTTLGGRTAGPYVSRGAPNVRRGLASTFASP